MNKAKKFKVHKKTKVKKLMEEIKNLKKELHCVRYDCSEKLDFLQRRLSLSERLAADMRPPVRWDCGPIDAYMEITSGRARRFVASEYVDKMLLESYCRDFEPYLREKMVHKIAHAILDVVPILKQKDRRTNDVRWLVDFYLLFPDHKEKLT